MMGRAEDVMVRQGCMRLAGLPTTFQFFLTPCLLGNVIETAGLERMDLTYFQELRKV